ncbi:MAG: carboxylating nicotinate-nucleotide diphosphorylase [Vulcanimicrobiaceae bacterium]
MKRLQNDPSPILPTPFEPHRLVVEPLIRAALLEDIGRGNDITTDAVVAGNRTAEGQLVARAPGVVAGLNASLLAFKLLGGAFDARIYAADGNRVEAGSTIADLRANARTLLTGERTALNLLGRLCGIATATRGLVDLIAGTGAHVVCTSKTTPGLRVLEKYAVRCGGGSNHRFGLDDAVLIKDNHLALAGSINDAVAAVRTQIGHMVKVEIEVDTLDQLEEALREPIDAVLLDNMSPEQLAQAIAMVGGRVLTEASGGIRPETILAVARSGVNLISVGWLTHGAPSLDIGLDIEV